MKSIAQQVKELILESETPLRMRDVMEINQFLIQHYIESKDVDTNMGDEEVVEVQQDADGDLVDIEGNIYDPEEKIRIGKKDIKNGTKTYFRNV